MDQNHRPSEPNQSSQERGKSPSSRQPVANSNATERSRPPSSRQPVAEKETTSQEGEHKRIVLYQERPIEDFSQDKLGFSDSVRVVSHVFQNIQPPLTFGIYGEWGSGRTSFMTLLRKDLEEKTDFLLLYFDCWPFKNEDNLVFPLLRSIQKELGITESFFVDAKKTALLSRVSFQNLMPHILPFDQFLAEKEKGSISSESYDEEYLVQYDLWVDQMQSLKKHLQRVIQAKLKGRNKSTLVVFVDNLDLCPAAIGVHLLEFFYNFFTLDVCITVVALDPNQAAKNIKNLHANLKLSQAFRYLERLVPYSFTLPPLTDFRLRNFILDSIYEILTDEEDIAKWESLRRKIDRLLSIYLEKEKENPKKIIKELNIFSLVFQLKTGQFPSIPMALFLIILRNFYGEVFKFILNYMSKGLVDLKALFDPNSDHMTPTGFQIRYGKQLAPYLQDFSLKNLMNSFRFEEKDWPLIEDYLNIVSFLHASS